MIHRLTTIPLSPSDYDKELNIIKQIAYNNGYSPAIVEKLLKKKQYNNCLKMIFPTIQDPHLKFITLTFNGNSSVSISSYLKKLDFKVAFRTNNLLGKLIKNNKTETNKLEKSGVYKLNCNDCPKNIHRLNRKMFSQKAKRTQLLLCQQKNSILIMEFISKNRNIISIRIFKFYIYKIKVKN